MVGVASGEGIGRRLPQWMVRKSNDVDDNKKCLEEEFDSQASKTKETNSIRTRNPQESALLKGKEVLMEDSGVPEWESNKRKSRKRKSSQVDKVQDAGVPNVVPMKKSRRLGRKPLESSLQQRKRLKDSGTGSSLDIQIRPLGDDDMELTVEDLMVIAKEFIEADEDRAHKPKYFGEHESDSPNQRISYSRNQSEGSLSSPNADSKQSSRHYNTSVPQDSSTILDCGKVDIGVNRTGDPARDMLDVFLGPLLKKSPEKEKSTFVIMDEQLSYDLKSQSLRNNDNVEEVVSVMKKKSSLKDQVAILLG